MAKIDERLLDPSGEAEIAENFNRVLGLIPDVTVTFDSNGGSDVAAQTIKALSCAVQPLDPTKEGSTFGGWKLGTADFDFSTRLINDIILTASWT